jgi:RNA polymerase primary sigma factor
MSFDAYISQFTSNDVLSNEQIVSLYNLFKSGEQQAFDMLVKSNMRLVLKVANDYRNYGMDFEDIVSNGTVGLMKAIHNFDPEKGMFSQYASVWINKYIRMGLDSCRGIHTKRYDRMSVEERSACVVESLNEKIGDGKTEFADSLEAGCQTPIEKAIFDDSVRVMLEAIDNVLDSREKFIVRLRNGLGSTDVPMTLEEIASKLNCTRERVRQLEKIAIGKIRKYMER